MPFIENNETLKALAPYRADQAFRVRILPGRLRRTEDLFDAHVLDALLESVAVDAIAVADQMFWRFLLRKGLNNLLSGPFGRRMDCYVEVHDASAIVTKNDEGEQDAERCRRDGEETNCEDVSNMIVEEGTPGL